MTFPRTLLALALSAASLAGSAAPSHAFSGGAFPACDAPTVLTYIQKRFVWTDENLLKRGLGITALRHPHENRREPTSEKPSPGRLYCHATAEMTDGRDRKIWYLIEAGWGFASIRDNVEFCIAGLDPWKVYGAGCLSVR